MKSLLTILFSTALLLSIAPVFSAAETMSHSNSTNHQTLNHEIHGNMPQCCCLDGEQKKLCYESLKTLISQEQNLRGSQSLSPLEAIELSEKLQHTIAVMIIQETSEQDCQSTLEKESTTSFSFSPELIQNTCEKIVQASQIEPSLEKQMIEDNYNLMATVLPVGIIGFSALSSYFFCKKKISYGISSLLITGVMTCFYLAEMFHHQGTNFIHVKNNN